MQGTDVKWERGRERERGLYITRLTIPVKTTDLKEWFIHETGIDYSHRLVYMMFKAEYVR